VLRVDFDALIAPAMAVWTKVPTERTSTSGRRNDYGSSRCNDDGASRCNHDWACHVVDADAQQSVVATEATSAACFGRRESSDAYNGYDEREGVKFDHGSPSSDFRTLLQMELCTCDGR
jgi:hypothetical protein